MRRLLPILILVIGVLAIYIDMPGSRFFLLSNPNAGISQPLDTKLGLDLRGGFEVKYGVDTGGKGPPSASQLETIRSIIEQRVNTLKVSEPVIQVVGNSEILVQVPGATDPSAVESLVGQAGNLEFVLLPSPEYPKFDTTTGADVGGTKAIPAPDTKIDASLYPPQFTGAQLDLGSISAGVNPKNDGTWQVNFAFAGDAATAFSTWSAQHVDEHFAIVLDGFVKSAPYIAGQITGQGAISGTFTQDEAKSLATILSYGALPYPLNLESSQDIPASLGQAFLDQTLFAGAIGIGLVLLFMLVYYRLQGLVACIALIYYGLAVLAIFRIIPVTLTLAGIAGFVLSVGMAVDANILIFERTKEELRTGKTLVTASEAGFIRAWNSIFDSNVSSLITASILYFFGTPTIAGFALVLMIGVATSMFTAVTVSRTLMRIVVRQQMAQKAWLYGVSDEEFQARAMGGRLARREARGRV